MINILSGKEAEAGSEGMPHKRPIKAASIVTQITCSGTVRIRSVVFFIDIPSDIVH